MGSRITLASAVALAQLLLSGCGWDQDGPPAVAHVDGKAISVHEFQSEVERRGQRHPGLYEDAAARRALLDEIILFESYHARAREAGFHEDPELVDSFRKMVVSKFRESRLADAETSAEISRTEVERYYRENSDDYRVPGARKAAVVFVAVPAHADEPARRDRERRAQAARAEAIALGSSVRHFGDVARRFSDDATSRYVGGEVGWLDHDSRFEPAVLDALTALGSERDVSPVIHGAKGLYLVKLIEMRPQRLRSFAECRASIRHQLASDRKRQHREDLDLQVRENTSIEIDEETLSTVSAPSSLAEAR